MSIETDNVKFCEDCRWAVPRRAPGWKIVLVCSCPMDEYNRVQRGAARWLCIVQRTERMCGAEGKWWEPKEKS